MIFGGQKKQHCLDLTGSFVLPPFLYGARWSFVLFMLQTNKEDHPQIKNSVWWCFHLLKVAVCSNGLPAGSQAAQLAAEAIRPRLWAETLNTHSGWRNTFYRSACSNCLNRDGALSPLFFPPIVHSCSDLSKRVSVWYPRVCDFCCHKITKNRDQWPELQVWVHSNISPNNSETNAVWCLLFCTSNKCKYI